MLDKRGWESFDKPNNNEFVFDANFLVVFFSIMANRWLASMLRCAAAIVVLLGVGSHQSTCSVRHATLDGIRQI